MMQVIPKWRVVVWVNGKEQKIWVNETHLSNVLRKIADMHFTETGLPQPSRITVDEVVC